MLVKYYLNDNIKASFEDFALSLRNAWAGPTKNMGCSNGYYACPTGSTLNTPNGQLG